MIIVEFMKDGAAHSGVNAGVLACILLGNKNKTIHFFAGKEHYATLLKILATNNIDTNNLLFHEIIPIGKVIRDYEYFKYQFRIVKQVFDYAKEHNEKNIIFLYSTTFSILFEKLFCYFNKNIKILSVIHSELEKIEPLEYTKKSAKNKVFTFLYSVFFGIQNSLRFFNPKNLNYLVYGDFIKNNLLKHIHSLERHTYSLPLPYTYSKNTIDTTDLTKKISFGFIGLSVPQKNSRYILKLLKTLENQNKNNFNISFSGAIFDSILLNYAKQQDFIYQESLSDGMISSELRDKTIEKMDYVLFTYYENSYKYTASLALLDAINYEKPIIAITNNSIKEYFDKYGNIGYLCDSYEDFEQKVISVINNFPKEEYKIQIENIKKIKEAENIINLSEQFKNITQKIFS